MNEEISLAVPPCIPHLVTVCQVGKYEFDSEAVHLARDLRLQLKLRLEKQFLQTDLVKTLKWVQCKHGRTFVDFSGSKYQLGVPCATKMPVLHNVPNSEGDPRGFPNCTTIMFDFSILEPEFLAKSKNVHVKLFDKRAIQTMGLLDGPYDEGILRSALESLFGVRLGLLSPVMIKMMYNTGAQLDLYALCRNLNSPMLRVVASDIFTESESVLASFGQSDYNGTKIEMSLIDKLGNGPWKRHVAVNAFTTGSVMISSSTRAAIQRAWDIVVRVVEMFPDTRPELLIVMENSAVGQGGEPGCCSSDAGEEPSKDLPH
jgi:hypothetical protein